jgi:hypothetical protein
MNRICPNPNCQREIAVAGDKCPYCHALLNENIAESETTVKQSKPSELETSPKNRHHEKTATMVTNSDKSEVVYYDQSNVLVTSKYIRTYNGDIIRLPDVCRVTTEYLREGEWIANLGYTLAVLGAAFGIWHTYPKDLGWNIILYLLPAIICGFVYLASGNTRYKVVAHCKNEVVTINYVHARMGGNTWEKYYDSIDQIHKAANLALQNSAKDV